MSLYKRGIETAVFQKRVVTSGPLDRVMDLLIDGIRILLIMVGGYFLITAIL